MKYQMGSPCIFIGKMDSKRVVHRLFGKIVNSTQDFVIVETADAARHRVNKENLAVYLKAPNGWASLFQRIEITVRRKAIKEAIIYILN